MCEPRHQFRLNLTKCEAFPLGERHFAETEAGNFETVVFARPRGAEDQHSERYSYRVDGFGGNEETSESKSVMR